MQQNQAPDSGGNVEMNLREQLLGQSGPQSTSSPYPPVPQPSSGPDHPYQNSDSTSPHDLAAAGSGNHHAADMSYSMSNDSGADDGLGDSRKGKRELSTSKRAAQNRAAQRAFRQRKEGYIRKMEEQIKEYEAMEVSYRALQDETYKLREEVMRLQAQLLDQQPGHSLGRRDHEPRAPEADMRPQVLYASSSRPELADDRK